MLDKEDQKEVVKKESAHKFRFGDNQTYQAAYMVMAPVYIGMRTKTLTWEVLPGNDLPPLIGLPVMRKLSLILEFGRNGNDVAKVNMEAEIINIPSRDGH